MVLFIGLGSIHSCFYDNPPQLVPFDCADVSYSTHIQPIWDSKCATTGCHDGNREPNLLSEVSYVNLTAGGYVDLNIPEESSLFKSVDFIENAMPPGGPKLPTQDIELVRCWISEGALNN